MSMIYYRNSYSVLEQYSEFSYNERHFIIYKFHNKSVVGNEWEDLVQHQSPYIY